MVLIKGNTSTKLCCTNHVAELLTGEGDLNTADHDLDVICERTSRRSSHARDTEETNELLMKMYVEKQAMCKTGKEESVSHLLAGS